MTAGMVLTMQKRYQAVRDAAVPLLKTPARDLTRAQAWLLLEYHQYIGELKVLGDFGKDTDDKVRLSTTMAGVQYLHALGTGNFVVGSNGARADPEFLPTPEFAIVLYRFAVRLKTTWDATHIVWGGIRGGRRGLKADCHGRGHCMDFYGAHTKRGGLIDVGRDWFHRPVYLSDGKLHGREKDSNDWWGADTKTTYRLLVTRDAEERDPKYKNYWNWRARDFFLDVFGFIADECNTKGDSSPAELRSGALIRQGVTMHPDYPVVQKRRDHWEHIHFQLGEAF